MTPRISSWLYKLVVIPQVTYAAVVWWGRTEVASTRMELQRLQRTVCIMITGTMRTTPTKVMEMLLDLPTLNTMVKIASSTTAYHFQRPDQKVLETGHGRICKKAETVDQVDNNKRPNNPEVLDG